MAFKPNYRMQRAERTRAKQAKAEEKLKARQGRTSADPDPEETVTDPESKDAP